MDATRARLGRVVATARWAALAGAALLLVVRWSGLTDGWMTNAVLAVTPLVLLVAAALLVETAVRRDGRGAAAAAAVLCAAAVTVAPRVIADPQPPAAGADVTVAVANLRLGRADPATVVRLVREERVDVLVTPELSGDAIRALREAGLEEVLPHTVLDPTPGREGGGIYSRHPMTATSPLVRGGGDPDVLVTLPSGETVHLTTEHPRPPINARFAASWLDALDALPSPDETPEADASVLAGDLNATLDHRPLRDLLDRGWRDAAAEVGRGLAPTYVAVTTGDLTPPLTIDHVLVDAGVAVRAVRTHHLPRSDHRMLVAELTLP